MFKRSYLSSYVWVTDPRWVTKVWCVIVEAGLIPVRRATTYSSAYLSVALLDGLVLDLDAHGWPKPPSGTRIVGPGVLRWLCRRLGVQAPTQLLVGEDRVPTETELEANLREQLADPDELRRRSALGLGVTDLPSLLRVLHQFFGASASPREAGASDCADQEFAALSDFGETDHHR